ncbi:Protein PTHB1 [Pteropus alecto]|uniref:Protein PTHB1 n=1 Tax=Pteropus alecto TaxID=9402 RepID=L5KNZ3_PTEAL|nr:Protein PTHB1 [Pteropus alecto]
MKRPSRCIHSAIQSRPRERGGRWWNSLPSSSSFPISYHHVRTSPSPPHIVFLYHLDEGAFGVGEEGCQFLGFSKAPGLPMAFTILCAVPLATQLSGSPGGCAPIPESDLEERSVEQESTELFTNHKHLIAETPMPGRDVAFTQVLHRAHLSGMTHCRDGDRDFYFARRMRNTTGKSGTGLA